MDDGELERVREECRALGERLQILSDVAHDFAAATADLPALIDLVARRIGEVIGDMAFVRLIAPDGEWFDSLAGVYHRDPARLAQARAGIAALRQRIGDGLTGDVAFTGRSKVMNARTADEFAALTEPKYAAQAAAFGITALAAAPLRAHGHVIGAISVYRLRPDAPYSDHDRRLLEDIIAHAGLAISNARLYAAKAQELTERLRTEEVLRRGFLEAAPDAILIADAAGAIVLVNSRAEELFGRPRAELIGRPVAELVPAFAYLDPPGGGTPALDGAGREFAAEINLSRIETPAGTLVAAAVRDVGERVRDLEERARRLEEASRVKSEFLASMSHELRTPLHSVIGFTELVHGGGAGPLVEPQREYLGLVLASSRELLQLIDDLLDVAQFEAGRIDVRIAPVDLAQLVADAGERARGLLAGRTLAFTTAVDPVLGAIAGDPRLLAQIVYSYLSNAIKFTPDGGTVALSIAPDGDDHFRIDVADTGIGIEEGDLERVFVELLQLDGGLTRRHRGTGLGLALVKRVVDALGGRVEVASTPGAGSRFSAILPRVVRLDP